jgi:hypothetical protein
LAILLLEETKATVSARSAVFPGTTVEIRASQYVVDRDLGPTTFFQMMPEERIGLRPL